MFNGEEIIEWDRKYYLRIKQALNEWTPMPIAKVEGNYLITPDGNKILDFLSGLVSVNVGQRQPKVIEAIKKALDNYGYVWELMQTPYKSEAAKLIIEDLLGPDNWAGRVRFVNSGSEANEEAFISQALYQQALHSRKRIRLSWMDYRSRIVLWITVVAGIHCIAYKQRVQRCP